ncbi:cytidylyltransferase domain-containing protein [Anaerocolumna aminovalerica]|uniref:acylneuraminate cytidylyltransferase family protein n=1 Tax=Anaerocolumna aminovalerica TaxID=1527 RepID=UPI000BE3D643|nr:acylneuraminate cytidylyltransferase family protein [Anaerocolumna aminovalerica]
MRNIAFIPARSGSKGVKDKNIRLLNGKPLLAYSIEAAKNSNLFDEIFVSTDSIEYADIAKRWGANVPFLRNEELATDTATTWDVVKDTLKNYMKNGMEFDTIAILQPTSPLRQTYDIISGYNQMKFKNANAIVSVCEVDHSPLWSNTLPEDGSLKNFLNQEILNLPRQSLPTYYRINGALYIAKTGYALNANSLYDDKCYSIIMSKENSIDIDSELDFIIAEALITQNLL